MASFKIARWEWKFVIGVAAAILVLTTIPYIFAAEIPHPGKQFMGFILNVSDHTQYLAWYKGFETQFLIPNNQTSEPNPEIFFNLLWWVLSRFGKLTGLDYRMVYQIFRWLSGAAFLGMVYAMAAYFFEDVFRRRFAFLVTALGSGLGWVWVVWKYVFNLQEVPFPLDIYVSEGNTFLCIMAYPHFMQAASFILAVMLLLLIGERQGRLRYAVWAGVVAFFLGWTHTYDLFLVWTIPVVYGGVKFLLERKFPTYWFRAMLVVGLVSAPGAIYSVLLTRLNPIWEAVLAQFDNAGVFTPGLLHMLILMGIPLMLALAALGFELARLVRHQPGGFLRSDSGLFVVVWFCVGWLLTYLPADFQIHMLNSWQVPIVLLMTVFVVNDSGPGLSKIGLFAKKRWLVALLAVAMVIPTNLYLFTWRFLDLSRLDYPYYLYQDEVAAMTWLEDNSPADSIVFSAYDPGAYIPGISGRVAFLSHWAQTVDFYGKRALAEEFYTAETSDARRQQILEQYQIDYVLHGPAERALGGFQPQETRILRAVFSSAEVNLYAVELGSP